MIPVAAQYRALTVGHHEPAWRAVVHPPTGDPLVLPLSGGTLSRSATWPRTTADLEVADTRSGRPDPDPRLLPYGNVVHLEWTIRRQPDLGWVRMGTLHTVGSMYERGTSNMWRLECVDGSALIDVDHYSGHVAWASADVPASAIGPELVRRTLPGTVVAANTWPDDATYDDTERYYGSPWQLLQDLADLSGVWVYLDHLGRFVAAPAPQIEATAVQEIQGGESGHLVSYQSRYLRGYNRVVIVYELEDGERVNGVWTRAGGLTGTTVSGRITELVVKQKKRRLPDKAAADRAAARRAARSAGSARVTTWETVPMPWLEPGDTVATVYATGRRELALVDEVRIPLDSSPMSIITRNPDWEAQRNA